MRKVQVVLQDDIDGSEPAQTVHFALDGTEYEIDLSEDHAAALRECLEPWIAGGRPATTSRIPEPRSRPRRSADTVDIRRWAEGNGIPVATRGRISVDLRSRYEAAH
ncbi:MAG TPA: Lsr2 family protein [Dermatophilaceae bacterium]|nr:Lsr2 family protein [Dermatophilaceae bacterium]